MTRNATTEKRINAQAAPVPAAGGREKALSFDVLDDSLSQLEAKLSALQSRRGRAPTQSPPAAREPASVSTQPSPRPAAPRAQVVAPPMNLSDLAAEMAEMPANPVEVLRSRAETEFAAGPARHAAPAPERSGEAPSAWDALSAPRRDYEAPAGSPASGAVAREIGRMRADVSGELGRRFEELGQEISSLRSSIASDRSSDMIRGEFTRVYDGLEAVAVALDKTGDNKELRHDLDGLRRAVDGLAQEETLHAVGRGQDELGRRLAQHQASVDPEIQTIRSHLDELLKRVDDGQDKSTLEAIERRLEQLARALVEVRRVAGEGPDLRSLEARLDDVTRVVVAASQVVPEVDTAPFERIEARIASHQRRIDDRDKRFDAAESTRLQHLDARLEALSRAQHATQDASAESAKGLAAKLDELNGRVSEESDRTVGRTVESLTPRFDQLVGRMENVDGSVGDVNQRIDGWGQRLTAEIARPRDPEINMFKALAARLDAVSDRLAELPDAGTDDQNWAALEARMTAVLHKLDQVPTDTPEASALDAIHQQISGIISRLDEPTGPLEGMDDLGARLDALTSRINEVASQAPSFDDAFVSRIGSTVGDQIEERLANRVEGQLTGRLDELTEVLNRTTAPIAEFGERMDALEESMGDTQVTLVETARTAAEEVVRSMLESQSEMDEAEAEAVHELDQDIKRLESLTVQSDERNNRTFDAVHETLLKIVDRLDQLDRMVAQATEAPDPTVVAATQAALLQANAAVGGPSLMDRLRGRAAQADGEHAPAPVSALAPAADAIAPAFEADAFTGMDPDTPLDPETREARRDPPGIDGTTGEPTFEGIVERVRADEAGTVDPADDFMAVARRKAQAVAEEAEFQGTSSSKTKGRAALAGDPAEFTGEVAPVKGKAKGKKDAKGKAKADKAEGGSALSRHRRPLLLAAVVAITAIIALPQIKQTLSGISSEAPPQAVAIEEIGPTVAPVLGGVAADAPEIDGAALGADVIGEDVAIDGEPLEADVEFVEIPVENIGPSTDPIETQGIGEQAVDGIDAALGAAVEAAGDVVEEIVDDAAALAPTGPVEDIAFGQMDGPVPLVAAAKGGDPRALYEIASRAAGNDAPRAFELYKAAAERGLAPAQYRLGQAYEKGRGTEQDFAEARRWYSRAADAGNASAMHNLAVLYAMGADGERDPVLAGQWFTRAAGHGVKDSQYNLGILHAQGQGVAQDLTESYKWFDAADKAGDPEAAAKREEIAAALSPAKLDEARAKVAAFNIVTPPVEANRVDVPGDWRVAKLDPADMKKAVRNVQAILNKNGFDAGTPDGVMGKRTRTAIMEFQKKVGQKPTGEIDDALVAALLERNA